MVHGCVGIRVVTNRFQETAAFRFTARARSTTVNNVLEEMRYTAAQIFLLVHTAGTDKHLHSHNRVGVIFLNKHRDAIVQRCLEHCSLPRSGHGDKEAEAPEHLMQPTAHSLSLPKLRDTWCVSSGQAQ